MAKPTGSEMVAILKEEKNPIKLAEQMDDFVNNYTADIKGFIEALKQEDEAVKMKFSTMSMLWIKKLNFFLDGKWFDLRNQYSVETADKIRKILGNDLLQFFPEYNGFLDAYHREEKEDHPFEVDFVEKLGRTHRTLQQTFSGMVFHWLSVMHEAVENEFFIQISKKIQSNAEEGFHHTPMI